MTAQAKKKSTARKRTTKHIVSVGITTDKDPDVMFIHNAFSLRIKLKRISNIAVTPIKGTNNAVLTLSLNNGTGVSTMQFTTSHETCMRAVRDFNYLVGMDDED